MDRHNSMFYSQHSRIVVICRKLIIYFRFLWFYALVGGVKKHTVIVLSVCHSSVRLLQELFLFKFAISMKQYVQ